MMWSGKDGSPHAAYSRNSLDRDAKARPAVATRREQDYIVQRLPVRLGQPYKYNGSCIGVRPMYAEEIMAQERRPLMVMDMSYACST